MRSSCPNTSSMPWRWCCCTRCCGMPIRSGGAGNAYVLGVRRYRPGVHLRHAGSVRIRGDQLLLLDVVRDVRRRLWPRVIGAVGARLVILVHLKVFVVHQSALRSSSFWDAQFIPHHGFGGQATLVWDGLRGVVDGAFTTTSQGSLAGSQWSWVLTLVFGVLLCVGAVEAARSSVLARCSSAGRRSRTVASSDPPAPSGMLTPLVVFYPLKPAVGTAWCDPEVRECPPHEIC